MLKSPIQKCSYFCVFFGAHDSLPSHILHYYIYCLLQIASISQGPLFPEVESGETMLAGVPFAVAVKAARQILQMFVSPPKMLKFYSERIGKIAAAGYLRFGGKQIAELDAVLEYLLTTYLEEYITLKII